MKPEEAQKEVENIVLGDEGESSTPEKPKEESSPEVKSDPEPSEKTPEETPKEETPEPVKMETGKDATQLQTQIDNLNVALKKEREEGKAESESLKEQLTESTALLDRLKSAFVPEPEPEDEIPDDVYLTPEQAEQIWEKKEEERRKILEDQKREEAITTEVSDLSKKWDGTDGKPKYVDSDVLAWQKENEKLYLSPSEAFNAMHSKELIDYEVKQRLANKKSPEEVETPSPGQGEHTPKESLPSTEAETRAAIIEAMDNAEAEV